MGGLALYAGGSLPRRWRPRHRRAGRRARAPGGRRLRRRGAGRAVIRDAWPRDEAASVLGYVTMGMTVAPMLAPILGSLLTSSSAGAPACWPAWPSACRWRWPLLGAAAGDAGRAADAARAGRASGGLSGLADPRLPRLCRADRLRDRRSSSPSSAARPIVVVQGMGYSPVHSRWPSPPSHLRRLGQRQLHRGAAGRPARHRADAGARQRDHRRGGRCWRWRWCCWLPPHILGFFLPMALVAIGNGMTQPSAIAGALSVRPQLAGTASALVGALQMGAAALATVLAGVTEGGSGIATGAWMLVGALGAQVALRAVRRAG